jgi:hypothetical protein
VVNMKIAVSWTWRHVVYQKVLKVSEEFVVPFFRVEERRWSQHAVRPWLHAAEPWVLPGMKSYEIFYVKNGTGTC